jgi:hypothetical protein
MVRVVDLSASILRSPDIQAISAYYYDTFGAAAEPHVRHREQVLTRGLNLAALSWLVAFATGFALIATTPGLAILGVAIVLLPMLTSFGLVTRLTLLRRKGQEPIGWN